MNIADALRKITVLLQKIHAVLQKMQLVLLSKQRIEPKPLPSLPVVVEQARREWINAQYYYNTVSDQDLIDHAVYMMQAAEKKYMYLLKQARRAGVVASPYMVIADGDRDKNEVITH